MDIKHMIDQMDAFMRDLTPMFHNYFSNLKKVGFTDAQALHMTAHFQNTFVDNILNPKQNR